MGKTYFTSDTHFGHANVIALDNRPFDAVEDMGEALIRNWNAKVRQCDTVYHLGDVFMGAGTDEASEVLERLNGEIRLILGNHDKPLSKWLRAGKLSKAATEKVVSVDSYKEVRSEGLRFCMSHYPMPCYNGRHHTKGSENSTIFMLHGHVHRTAEHYMMRDLAYGQNPAMQLVNVGCMLWGYAPVSIEDVVQACNRPCGSRTDSECRRRFHRFADGCVGCPFGRYWHDLRRDDPDMFKAESICMPLEDRFRHRR